jgi:hypothetical protein
VVDATARGLDPLLAASFAPDFAEGAGRPDSAVPGAWRPDPAAFGRFGEALAGRYSGAFVPPGASAPLPRVQLFQAWTEPNLSSHLAPQYGPGTEPVGPELFRGLLNAFNDGVKRVSAENVVVTGGTAPYGDPKGGERTRPVRFWRDVFCLRGRTELKPIACPARPRFDVFAHNAINTSGGPTRGAVHPDDASTPDLDRLRRVLRAGERRNTVAAGRHRIWITELWWESDPPDPVEGLPLGRQARYLQQALYLLWRDGASLVVNLQLQDTPFDRDDAFGETAAGVLFEDGSPKPAFTAWRFPFVVDPGRDVARVWGRAPLAGELRIERRAANGWRRIDRLSVRAGEVFTEKLRIDGAATLRASVGEDSSLPWRVRLR